MSNCLTCGRTMVIARGNMCRTCDERIQDSKSSRETSGLIADTLGTFSLFEDGPPEPSKFIRRNTMRKRVKLKV